MFLKSMELLFQSPRFFNCQNGESGKAGGGKIFR